MRPHRHLSRYFGRFRGERLVIASGGPSFADVDPEEFRDWFWWPVNASILEVPDWVREDHRTRWFAGHIEDFLHKPNYSEFRARLLDLYPRFRIIGFRGHLEDEEVKARSDRFWYFTGDDFPVRAMGCTFNRALYLAGRLGFDRVVAFGVDFKKAPGTKTIYAPPFDWRPASPNNMADHDRIARQLAAAGHIAGTVKLHRSCRWTDPPLPYALP